MKPIHDYDGETGTEEQVAWEISLAEGDNLLELKELQAEIEPYAVRLDPEVVMFKATPNLSSLADWVERFLTIMRSDLTTPTK